MTYLKLTHGRVTAFNFRSLMGGWRLYQLAPVGFAVSTPLTASQLRRLPAGLRARLVQEVAE